MGAKCQTTLFFFWNPLTFHWRRRFLTESWKTQATPKRANKKIQSSLVLVQWIKMWSIASSLSLQKLHLLTICHPLFIKMSTVKIFPQTASQAKKQVLRGTRDPQTSFLGKTKLFSPLREKLKWPWRQLSRGLKIFLKQKEMIWPKRISKFMALNILSIFKTYFVADKKIHLSLKISNI